MENEKKVELLGKIVFHIEYILISEGIEKPLANNAAWLVGQCLDYVIKINPDEQNEGVVEREEVKVNTGMYDAWNEAKKGPVSTQEEIGDRWKDAEKDG